MHIPSRAVAIRIRVSLTAACSPVTVKPTAPGHGEDGVLISVRKAHKKGPHHQVAEVVYRCVKRSHGGAQSLPEYTTIRCVKASKKSNLPAKLPSCQGVSRFIIPRGCDRRGQKPRDMRRLRYCVSYFTRTVNERAFRISGNCFARWNREKAALPCSDIIHPFFSVFGPLAISAAGAAAHLDSMPCFSFGNLAHAF